MSLCGRVSWPAERETLIPALVDGPVRLAADDIDIFVGGAHLSAGLIAGGVGGVGMLHEASWLNQPCWRVFVCLSRSGFCSQQFSGLIDSKQYKCALPLTPNPISPHGFRGLHYLGSRNLLMCFRRGSLNPRFILSSPPLRFPELFSWIVVFFLT